MPLNHSESPLYRQNYYSVAEPKHADTLNALSQAYCESGHYDSALILAQKAYDEAYANDDIINLARASKNKAEALYSLNAYTESIRDFEQAIRYFEQAGLYEEVAYGYNVIGILYRKQFNYKKAMENIFTSLRIAEENNLLTRKSSALHNVAILYHNLLQYDQAIDYYRQSLKIDEIRNDTLGMAKVYCNLGICYRAKNNLNEALNAYQLSYQFYEALRDTEGLALTLNNIGVLYLKTGRYEEAYDKLQRALKFFHTINDVEGEAYTLNSIGEVYYYRGQIHKALDANDRALRMTKDNELRKNIYESLMHIYASRGHYRKAYEYHQLFSAVRDSILNRENSQQLTEIHARYETEKKEQEITYLKILNDRQRDHQVLMMSGLMILLFLAVSLYLNRQRIIKNRQQLGKINSCFLSFGYDSHKNIQSLTVLFGEMTGANIVFYLRSKPDGYDVVAHDRAPNDFPSFFPYNSKLFPSIAEITSDDIQILPLENKTSLIRAHPILTATGSGCWIYCPVKYDGAYRGLFVAGFSRQKKISREERRIFGILTSAAGSEEEQRLAEEALQSSERRYHDLFDQSLGFIGVHDLRGQLQMVNPAAARSLGYTQEEMRGRNITDFLNPAMKKLFPDYLEKISKNGFFSGMMRVVTKEGQPQVWIFYNILYHEADREPFVLGHALDITELVVTRKEREKLIHELQRTLANVRTLSGLLPICAACKKIRDDKGYWNQIENYISVHSNAEFSHGICPECQHRLYPELFDENE